MRALFRLPSVVVGLLVVQLFATFSYAILYNSLALYLKDYLLLTKQQTYGVVGMMSTTKVSLLSPAVACFVMGCGLGTTALKCLITDRFAVDDAEGRETALFMDYCIPKMTGNALSRLCHFPPMTIKMLRHSPAMTHHFNSHRQKMALPGY